MGERQAAESKQIECSAPRTLFAEWLAVALGEARLQPSPMATAYLVELLAERMRAHEGGPKGEKSLAEALLTARRKRGVSRIRSMRDLGDHALFVSGFFGDSLGRSAVGASYYQEIGGAAYGEVAVGLRDRGTGPSWARLYGELAQDFADFADLLGEVGDRSRPSRPDKRPGRRSDRLLRIYERYLRTGSSRDRSWLIRGGHLPPDCEGLRWWQ
jgi:hypothetical protein